MTLKMAGLILILIVVFFAVVRGAIWCVQVADFLFESDQNPAWSKVKSWYARMCIYRLQP